MKNLFFFNSYKSPSIMIMQLSLQPTYFILIVLALSLKAFSFQFREIQVTVVCPHPSSMATYHLLFNRTITNALTLTDWSSSPLFSNSTVVVNFPSDYTLTMDIECSYSLNSSSIFLPTACVVNKNQITLVHLFEDETYLATLTIIIKNVAKPIKPAIMECFMSRIGSDMAICERKTKLIEHEPEIASKEEMKIKKQVGRSLEMLHMSNGAIDMSSRETNASSVSYNFTFTLGVNMSSGGIFIVNLPSSISISQASGICYSYIETIYQQTPCIIIYNSSNFIINFTSPNPTSTIAAGTIVTLQIANTLINPPTTAPVSFTVTAYDQMISTIQSLAISFSSYLPNTFRSASVSSQRLQNGVVNIFTLNFNLLAALPQSSLIYMNFPSALTILSSSLCQLYINGTLFNNISVEISGNIFKVRVLSDIPSSTSLMLDFINIRNPLSTQPYSGFIYSLKTADDAYYYSYAVQNSSLMNSITSLFKSIDSAYTISSNSLIFQLSFQLSQTELLPAYLLLTLSISNINFISMSCSETINWSGNCIDLGNKTIKMTGSFSSGEIGVKMIFSNISMAYGSLHLASFSSKNYMIDESSSDIKFQSPCSIQCKTCNSSTPSNCSTCHTSLLVSSYLYYYAANSTCLNSCPSYMYANTNNYCTNCNFICLNCLHTSTFCTSCRSNSSDPYLNVSSNTQTCVANCSTSMTPVSGLCVCNSSFLTYKDWCVSSCPTGYESNGKNCIVTASVSPPLVFSICGLAILMICPLGWIINKKMLVFIAISSLLGLLQGAILIKLCILMIQFADPSIWHAIVQCLVLACVLNITTVIFLTKSFSNHNQFNLWLQASFHKVAHALITIISLIFSHKFKGLLFSGCCGLKLFSIRLKESQLPIFTFSILSSLVVSTSVIFVAATALGKYLPAQLRDCCLDAIVLFSGGLLFSCLSLHGAGAQEQAEQNHLEDSTTSKRGVKHEKSGYHSNNQMEIESRA